MANHACPQCGGLHPPGGGCSPDPGHFVSAPTLGVEPAVKLRSSKLAPGSMVGEYKVVGQIGEGGMGAVFAGVQPLIDKKVAIKVLNAAFAFDAAMVQRFMQEARAVNRIDHPNIVDVFSFGQLDDG